MHRMEDRFTHDPRDGILPPLHLKGSERAKVPTYGVTREWSGIAAGSLELGWRWAGTCLAKHGRQRPCLKDKLATTELKHGKKHG